MKLAGRGEAVEPKVPAPLPEGHLLAGKYRIERVIGAGGMGVVVAATHVHIGQRVAIKFLLPHATDDAQAIARFAREARALARIENEHVGRVIDVGVLDTGQPYTVLECLTGQNLAELLRTRGALHLEEAVAYVIEACEAMTEAHALGIIHRDLKPENLFLAERADGSRIIKVIDFGVSKILGDVTFLRSAELVTITSAVVGSPLYMSPEQLRAARDVDVRTDIWSLGVTLYELLTGQGPFRWSTLPELCAAILKDPARPLRELRPSLPEQLEAVVMRCLEKDPARRPASARELAQELFRFVMLGEVIGRGSISPAAVSVCQPFLPASSRSRLVLESLSAQRTTTAPLPPAPRPAEPYREAQLTQASSAGANVAPEPSSDRPFEGQMRPSTLTPPIGLSTVASVPPRRPPSLRAVKAGLVALLALGAFAGILLAALPAPAPVITQAASAPKVDAVATARPAATSAAEPQAPPAAAKSAAGTTPIAATASASAAAAPSPKGRKPDRAVSPGASRGAKPSSGHPFRKSYPESVFDHRK